MDYNLIVIGAGPGGYTAALNAARNGKRVLIVEKDKIGGVCLNSGCIPTKSFLYSAKILDNIKNGEKYGVVAENIKINHEKVLMRKNKIVKTLVAGIKSSLKNGEVEILNGNAKINPVKDNELSVTVGENTYTTENIIIATGSSPFIPPIKGAREMYESGFLLTNEEILNLKSVPEKLVIIGGGVIGLELGSYFNSVGSEVTIIEMMSKIANTLDLEISNILLKNYEKKGIKFLLDSKVVEVTDHSVIYEYNGEKNEVEAKCVLMSIGRKANTESIGLEDAGVEFDRIGIKTNETCSTNVPGIYAIGDVNGKIMLAHTAYREADVSVNTILGIKDSVDYANIPSVIYTNPETASTGETEETAKEKGYNFESLTVSMRYSGRYLAENEGGDGICKMIIDKDNNVLLGVHMIANYASEIIYGAGMMIQNKTKINDLKNIVFPHPSVCEILREGLLEYK